MIFDQERHESLLNIDWNEDLVRTVIKDIFEKTISGFNKEELWPTDPNEASDISSNKSIYFGAAGNLWALDKISNYLSIPLPLDKEKTIDDIYNKYMDAPDSKEVVPSLFLGEVGILLVKYKYNPSKETEERLYKVIKANIENETLEALWGAPGTMIGASFMYEWSNDKKWSELFIENVNYIVDELKKSIEREEIIWTQNMYGRETRFVGAGHGYFGNIFGILKKLNLISEIDRDFILSNVSKTTIDLALIENGLVNWPPTLSADKSKLPLVQWCHGSPGVITALESFPIDYNQKIEELLLGAGELVWKVGPLKKGIALCHGTDGNGFAFLQLYKRTNDVMWLDRARKFAMHAINQRNGRFTLFTGELGLAMYLISCIEGDGRFPVLDYI